MLSIGGETLSARGASAIGELEAVNTAQGVTLLHGWPMGSMMNLSSERVLDLAGDMDFVHDGNGTMHVGLGTMALEGETSGHLDAGAPLFTNDSWSILLMLDKLSRDTTTPDEGSFLVTQYNGFANGHAYITGAYSDAVEITLIGAGTIYFKGTSIPAAPVVAWLTYDHATRVLSAYDAFTGDSFGTVTGVDLGGGDVWREEYSAKLGLPATAPRLVLYGGIFKFSGVLTESQRDALFSTYYSVLTRFVKNILVYGNSVTGSAFASHYGNYWVGLLRAWGASHNSYVWMPANMGGRGLYHFRPDDYELPAERAAVLGTLVDPVEGISVDSYLDKRINFVVFDENQNTSGGVGVQNGAEVIYSDFAHVRNAIVEKLREQVATLKVIGGTMIAPWQVQDGVTTLGYAGVSADLWRTELRDWSAEIRVDPDYDAVFDLYAAFSIGWEASDDGDAANPETDLPNGNPDYFTVDHQHPNDAGHQAMFDGYSAAIDSVALDLGDSMSLLTDLTGYWPLNEASGNAIDAHGSNDLTESGGTIATDTGHVGATARDFEAGDTEGFTLADNADLSTGDISFTVSAWVKAETLSGFPAIVAKWDGETTNSEFILFMFGTTPAFSVGRSNTLTTRVESSQTASTGVWYHLVGRRDKENDQLKITVNNVTSQVAYTADVNNGSAPFEIGANVSGGLYWDGLIEQVGFWKRALTDDEVADLYNAGAGLAYDDLGTLSVEVTGPAAASRYLVGESIDVEWNYGGDAVDVLLSKDGGETFPVTVVSATADDGLYSFTASTEHISADVVIRVRDAEDDGVFDDTGSFVIATTTATVGGVPRSRLINAGCG